MLTFEQLQELVLSHIDLVEIDQNSFTQTRERAAKFLVIQAHLANHLKFLDDIKVKASTLEKAQYAQTLLQQTGKNITENKIMVEADPIYASTRESVELVDAERDWTKRHHQIFENAHVMFRQHSNEK